MQIIAGERAGLKGCEENLRIRSRFSVVDAGIFAGEFRRKLRIARRKTRPELAADRRAHAVRKMIVVDAGPRRADSERKVFHCHGILVDVEIHVPEPDVRQNVAGDIDLFHFIQSRGIHCLKFQIVVGD